jgi:hypothetical protein
MQKEIAYLGHVISAGGVKVDPQKTAAVADWPEPKTLRHVRSFLGFSNYFRKFIQGYSKIVSPLHDLTKGVQSKFQNITHKWNVKKPFIM